MTNPIVQEDPQSIAMDDAIQYNAVMDQVTALMNLYNPTLATAEETATYQTEMAELQAKLKEITDRRFEAKNAT